MLGGALHRIAADRIAIVDPQRTRTYGELARTCDALAAKLRELGRRAVLLLPQDGDAIALAAACDVAGTTAVYVSALYGVERARALLETTDAECLVTIERGELVVIERRATATRDEPPEVWLLSSGTTGAPKCVRHTWERLAGAVSHGGARAGDVWLLAYPISHFAALQVAAQCLISGARLVIPADFSPAAALDALETGVTCLSCTPTYLRRLLLATPEDAWPRTRLAQITLGGEAVDQRLLDHARRVLPDARIIHIYASTELGAAITVRDGRAGFDAALVDGEQLKIVDGELWVRRTPRAMLGYANAAPPAEWAATGDLVEVVDGRVAFRGRTSDVINVGGFKVNPAEVEAVVREVPGVVEAWVVGHKSSLAGNLVKAVLCLAAGADPAAIKREVTRRCSERLPSHMTPRLFEIADQAEMSMTQKLVRRPS